MLSVEGERTTDLRLQSEGQVRGNKPGSRKISQEVCRPDPDSSMSTEEKEQMGKMLEI